MSKKLVKLLFTFFTLMALNVGYANNDVPENSYFTSTVRGNIPQSFNSHLLQYSYTITNLDVFAGSMQGFTGSFEKNDIVFKPGLGSPQEIQVKVKDYRNDKNICILSFNLETHITTWFLNAPIKLDDSLPPINCSTKYYKNHLFVFVNVIS